VNTRLVGFEAFVGVVREAQAYVRCVEQGLTVFDLPEAQAQIDTAQWKPIVAWLEPQLRTVRKPVLRGNPSVQRPSVAEDASQGVDDVEAETAWFDAPLRAVATPVRSAALARVLPAAPTPVAPAAPTRVAPAAVAPVPSLAVDPARPALTPEPVPRSAPSRVGALFGWLTTPRFLHRNT